MGAASCWRTIAPGGAVAPMAVALPVVPVGRPDILGLMVLAVAVVGLLAVVGELRGRLDGDG
jgi:hypothetical protein